MPAYAPVLQLIGVVVLAVAAAVWAAVVLRLLRRSGLRAALRRGARPLSALPRQGRSGPALESVELTPAEQDAFAGLVRRLANG
ncbi:hypothetical protein GCM10010503_00520 [Streptomyces lucensis JCM 4490]|uniref:Uncharacterized protein n=1 Tax=Streptomyces lucensis JCM 4490 TaxID=1306176 RepID=A0A918MJJ5_9ACTN|nr:hypothetical protein [Streptomyces lucensis]GGW28988.1 hypothetical protein GCM10010503_00520 [Streptomyces lucensis JCM 4490]